MLLENLIQFFVLLWRWNTSAGRLFLKRLVKWALSLQSSENFFYNFGKSLKICWNYGCYWWNAHNLLMISSWLGKTLVPSSLEWRTPFNLPGKAVMRWQASSLSPGKFQAHYLMFLKVLRLAIPYLHRGYVLLQTKAATKWQVILPWKRHGLLRN